MRGYLVDDGSNDGPVTGIADLDARLDALHPSWLDEELPLSARIVIDLDTAEQRTLYLALGQSWSVLTYEVGLDSFWLWASVGDASLLPDGVADDTGQLTLALGNGECTWTLAASAVPVGTARDAARQYLTTGTRPGCLTWREH